MENNKTLDNDVSGGLDDIHSVVRRQFAASVVAAVIIAAVAGVTALRPVHHETPPTAAQRYVTVQQPVFVANPSARLALLTKRPIELP
jgi:hypothetical protein